MMKIDRSLLRKKILGAWLGKAVGGTLGQPWEGSNGPLALEFYDPVPTEMMPNDDLDLQVLWACKLAAEWDGVVDKRNFEKAWLSCVDFPFDEYGVAIRNLKRGIHAPHTGYYDNYFTDGLGAAIRAELWGCLAPGDPALAAKFAYEDACVDHAGNGIYAEQYLAAMASMAFVESDCRKLIEAGLSVIPAESLLAKAIRDTIEFCRDEFDIVCVRAKILQKYNSANFTDVKMNLAFETAALLLGGGDFSKTICYAVNCGRDTDCTGATVGAILGIADPDRIPEKWLAPLGRSLVVSKEITGINPPDSLDGFTDLVLELQSKVRLESHSDPAFDPEKYAIKGFLSDYTPWFIWDFRKFTPKAAKEEREMQLPGNLLKLDFHNARPETLTMLRVPFSIPHDQKLRLLVNTPANVNVWVDGVFAFGRESGAMLPAFHRAPQNQRCDLELKAGKHELLMGIAPAFEGMNSAPLLFGLADLRNFWESSVVYGA
ncbi:MAG: ADP-ribosylglycohydrolase family protein [Victivallaceae bacterium]|nr:ADP-ribosylglycohydrolase family protein [Victivallaceae bacterium]